MDLIGNDSPGRQLRDEIEWNDGLPRESSDTQSHGGAGLDGTLLGRDLGTLGGSAMDGGSIVIWPSAEDLVEKKFEQAHLLCEVDGKTKCITCGKEFEKKFEATKHTLGHTKPYKCRVCGAGSGQKKDAVRHVATVHRDKLGPGSTSSYRCGKCLKEYERQDNMQRHYKTCKGVLVAEGPTWGERLRGEFATIGGRRLAPAPKGDKLVSSEPAMNPVVGVVRQEDQRERIEVSARSGIRVMEIYLRDDVHDYEIHICANSGNFIPGNSTDGESRVNLSHLRDGDKSLTLRYG